MHTKKILGFEVYSSDFEAANEGEIIQIPATVEFSFMVKDKDEMIELAKQKTTPFCLKIPHGK